MQEIFEANFTAHLQLLNSDGQVFVVPSLQTPKAGYVGDLYTVIWGPVRNETEDMACKLNLRGTVALLGQLTMGEGDAKLKAALVIFRNHLKTWPRVTGIPNIVSCFIGSPYMDGQHMDNEGRIRRAIVIDYKLNFSL